MFQRKNKTQPKKHKTELTFEEHLDELRKMLMKVSLCVVFFMGLIFCFKETVFGFLLAPCQSDFISFRILRELIGKFGIETNIYTNNVELITTDISSQFMAHLSASFYIGLLLASPYVLYELMRYITPALYDNEKKYASRILVAVYGLFVLGMVISYLVLFPVSCRFLSSYNVSPDVKALISLDSYLSLFVSLTFLMGLVFQLPVIAISLAKRGLINSSLMTNYRKHAFILIVVLAAIITPPDILTLIIVSIPLYLLYEVSVLGVKWLCEKNKEQLMPV